MGFANPASSRVVRVIGAGFGRTGTLSLKRALEDLGFGPTYHMQEIMRRPAHIESWRHFARTGDADWEAMFAGFGSGVDYPVCCVWDTLASQFPDAKVVLTVRDPESWWTSTATTIHGFRTAFAPWVQRSVPAIRHFVEMVDGLVWDGLFDGRFLDREYAVDVFEKHIERVRATCPSERLLVFDVAQGWEPLCDFLNVPMPAQPFPRLNDATVTRRVVRSVRWGTRALPVMAAATAVGMFVHSRARTR